jgi:signal transduction histidine kinase/AmiR/NasT family two-component response regulator
MPKVLIIDDDISIVEDTSKLFEFAGWEVAGASNGERALELLDFSFDAVVLDLKMPLGMSGEDVLSRIREQPRLNGVCVLVLTAYGEIDSAVRCLRRGAYQYLQKPFLVEDMKRILISGIALQKAHALRRDLLALASPDLILKQICSIFEKTVNPSVCYAASLGEDGSVCEINGAKAKPLDFLQRGFVRQVMTTNRAFCGSTDNGLKELGPITAEAKSLLAAPIPGAGGRISGIFAAESKLPGMFDYNWVEVASYFADILGIATEVERHTQQMLQSERKMLEAEMEAERKQWRELPIIVNELRHHISTPAQVIAMHAREFATKDLKQAASKKPSKDVVTRMAKRIKAIRRNADAITRVCTYLKDVSNETPLDKRQFNLVRIVQECSDEVTDELHKKHIRLTVGGKPKGGLTLRADPNLIKYCLQCLLRNSIEAIEERRNQALETDFDPKKSGDQIALQITDKSPDGIQISVQDTGIGISAENKERVFQPLFSTKQRHEPGGMGLFGVRRIMNQHEGKVSFESHERKGATFTLSFPKIG